MKTLRPDAVPFRRIFETAALAAIALSAVAAASACGADNAIVGGSCAEGYTQCGLACVDTADDPRNCGECGNVCRAGTVCEEGSCRSEGDASATDGSTDALRDSRVTDGPTSDRRASEGGTTDGMIGDGVSGDGKTADRASGDVANDATGDSCIAPFDTHDSCGECGHSCSVVDDCVIGDAGIYECVAHCSPTSADPDDCNGQCVDETSDPDNCGRCGKVCASGYCSSSLCQGTTGGDIVVIGDDYNSTATVPSAEKILTNAVFLPTSNPIQILAFAEYADPTSVSNVTAILAAEASLSGRKITLTTTSMEAYIPAHLTNANYDVLIVYDQTNAAPGVLGPLGTSWASTLATFTGAGGIVVSLDGASGTTQEMPLFNTSAALLAVSADTLIAPGAPLDVIAGADAIGHGVVTPYAAKPNSVYFTTSESNGGNVTYVVVGSPDAGQAPVVVHKAVP